SQSLRDGGLRGHVSQAAEHVPSEIALADPHGSDYLWIAFGIIGAGVPVGAPGIVRAPPPRRAAALARRARLRRELLQQYLGPLSNSAATLCRAGDDAG